MYGPAAEIFFRLCAKADQSLFFLSLLMTLFDIGVLLFLILLLRMGSMEARHLILYAFNPLVLLSIAGEGHLESMVLFWLAGTYYFLRRGWPLPMSLLFGMAAATKLTPFFLLPFLINRKSAVWSPLAFAPFLLLYSIYSAAGMSFLSVPMSFASGFHFNGLAASVFSWVVPYAQVPLPCLLLFVIIWTL